MLDLLMVIGACTLLSYGIDNRTRGFPVVREGIRRDVPAKLFYLIILVWIIVFAGTRTAYNDTKTYMDAFQLLTGDIETADIFEPYGGFDFFQKLIKNHIKDDPQVMVFLAALICCGLTIAFIARHTKQFSASMFLFLITDFMFSMAGIKQALAMTVALYAVEGYLKRRYIWAILLMLVAITFHPYVVCLVSVIFLKDRVLDRKTLLLVALFALLFINLEQLSGILTFLGKDPSDVNKSNYTINPIRVVVEAVPVVISFVYRSRIRRENDPYLNMGANMRIISFTFMFLGLFYNPIYLGRMATFFSLVSAFTIPKMLRVSLRNEKNQRLLTLAYYAFFGLYFLLDLTKIGTISLKWDQFYHVSFLSLFQ